MTLEDAYFLSQIVAAIAIVASLIFVGLQLRQNTLSQKVVAVQSLTAAVAAVNAAGIESPALGSAVMNATRDWASASRDERIVAHYFLFCYFKLVEQAWYQYRSNVLDAGQWAGWERGVRWFYHSPGVKSVWWPNRSGAYSAEFQVYLASTAPAPDTIGALSNIFDPPAPSATAPASPSRPSS